MTFTNKKSTAVPFDSKKHILRFEAQDLLQSLTHKGDNRVIARVRGRRDLVEWVELNTLPCPSKQEILDNAVGVLSGEQDLLPIEEFRFVGATAEPVTDWNFTKSEPERAKRRVLRRIGKHVKKVGRKGRLHVER